MNVFSFLGSLPVMSREKSAKGIGAGGKRRYNEMKLIPWPDESVLERNL
jgi:hypothetical protein